jgi:hypothetical protein
MISIKKFDKTEREKKILFIAYRIIYPYSNPYPNASHGACK